MSPTTETQAVPRQRKTLYDVLCSWFGVYYMAILVLAVLVWNHLLLPSQLEAGNFKMTFRQQAEELKIQNTQAFQGLKNLNEKELKIFLIAGGQDAEYYIFQDRSMSGPAMHQIYEKLQADSLLRIATADNGIHDTIYPTAEGIKVHSALIKSLYSQF